MNFAFIANDEGIPIADGMTILVTIRAELNCVAIEIVSADSHQGKPHALLAEHCGGNFVTCGQISAATHRKVEEEEITGP